MQRLLFGIDRFSAWTGKIAAWLIVVMTVEISYDIIIRKLSQPFPFLREIWFTYYYAYDATYYLYAMLFMLGGAYALSRGQHLRGDVFYRLWPVRVQAAVDVVLYLFAFTPGILALISTGTQWALLSMQIGERSFSTALAPPIWPLKWVIPIAGSLMLIQGVAEWSRALIALRTGVWPPRLMDVEETETALAASEEL